MIASLLNYIDLQALILLLILLVSVRAFGRIISDPDNDVQLSDFYSSRGADGKEHGDPDKLAKLVGVFASTLFVGYTFWAHAIDSFWPVAVFCIWLIFISGVSVFSAWARALAGHVMSTRYGKETAAQILEEKKP